MQDRGEEAKNILLRLHDDPSDPHHSFARSEYVQIQKQLALDRTLDDSWKHIFSKPSLRKRFWLTIGTTGFIQCSGVLVINSESRTPSLRHFTYYHAQTMAQRCTRTLAFRRQNNSCIQPPG